MFPLCVLWVTRTWTCTAGVGLICVSSYHLLLSQWEEPQHLDPAPQITMPRISLRLDDSLLDRSLPHCSASFSAGGANWSRNRSRRSQQLSVSCSESFLVHPSSPLVSKKSRRSFLDNSVHSVASDASLLSSLLDESSVQDVTLVDTVWGLDQDLDPKESTIIEQSSTVVNSTLIGSHDPGPTHQVLSRLQREDYQQESTTSTIQRAAAAAPASSAAISAATLTSPEAEAEIFCRPDQKRKTRTDVLQQCVVRAAAWSLSALTHTWQMCQQCFTTNQRTAPPAASRTMKTSLTTLTEPRADGSQCEDCRKQHSVTETGTRPCTSVSASCWSALVFALVLTWRAAVCTGIKAREAFRWLGDQWHHRTKRDSTPLHSGFSLHLTVLLPLLLLLLLLSLAWFSPGLLHSVFDTSQFPGEETPAVSAPSTALSSVSSQRQHAEEESPPSSALSPEEEETSRSPERSSQDSSEQWVGLEQRLAAMWERVETEARWAEQRHTEVLQLYAGLQQQLTVAGNSRERDGLGPWFSGVLDHQLTQVRRKLDQEKVVEQRRAASRLNELERRLQTLTANTEQQLQRSHSPPSPDLDSPPSPPLPAASVCVERQSHDALLAEVARLELVLEEVKQSIEVLSDSKDNCGLTEAMQQTVSTQVREEVRAVVYGNQLMTTGGVDYDPLPVSLLQWLTQRYVSGTDLQEALSSLERSILQNISLKQQQQHGGAEAVSEAVTETATPVGGAVTLEDVQVIVKNALRLFSQDQTGLADYALESGGGSILSIRCSESYQTKAALLSLFGIPLWYFSQSPRTVIQPDVHPGNCWAFRGSTGCLVIRLSMRILPTAFSLEHIPKALAPSGTLHSAPREFNVYGLENASEEKGKLLGAYTYDQDGDALQTFATTEENDQTFQIVEIQVLSNWGHEDFTCMYRFRVHGTPQTTGDKNVDTNPSVPPTEDVAANRPLK